MEYNVIKALHIIAVVTWFAGLFYLPRLFVYHVQASSKAHEVFCTMERRLLNAIMHPSLLAVWGFGVWLLILNPGWAQGGWLHTKILFVFLLTLYHFSLAYFHKQLRTGTNKKSARFFKIYNEVPSLLLVLIVFLVVLKPF
jgi:putative membrane protein